MHDLHGLLMGFILGYQKPTITGGVTWKIPGGIIKLPGLVMTNSLLLKMAIEIVSFPVKNGGSFHSFL